MEKSFSEVVNPHHNKRKIVMEVSDPKKVNVMNSPDRPILMDVQQNIEIGNDGRGATSRSPVDHGARPSTNGVNNRFNDQSTSSVCSQSNGVSNQQPSNGRFNQPSANVVNNQSRGSSTGYMNNHFNMNNHVNGPPINSMGNQFNGMFNHQVSSITDPDLKRQMSAFAMIMGPMFQTLGHMITSSIEGKMKNTVQMNDFKRNNVQVQGALIEGLYERDRLECRQNYANLRVSGVQLANQQESTTAWLINYAKKYDVKMTKGDFVEVKEVGKYGSLTNLHVQFKDIPTREKFVEAKFGAINAKKKLKQQLRDDPNSEEVDQIKRKITAIETVKISEDLTPRRFKLLRFVKKLPWVKTAYTRNAVIHAIAEKLDGETEKVKIYSANDLHKLEAREVSLEDLLVPQQIIDIVGCAYGPSA